MKKLSDIFYSFPFQLLIMHLRSNLLLIFTWALLALTVTGNFGGKFGLRYLFLSPEYMGKVGFWSFYYLGIGFGALVMSWNLTTYLLSAYRFSFLASLGRPFTKFALNNMLVPAGFMILFFYCQFNFGSNYEMKHQGTVIWDSVGFFMGFISLVLLISLYFNFTNQDIFSLLSGDKESSRGKVRPRRDDLPLLEDIRQHRNQWRVDTYLTETFHPRIVRSVAHYDPMLLLRVFRQNHLNALVVQLFTFVILIMLGAFMDRPALRIPTGASIFLMASIMMAMAGAVSYWFNKWRVTGILVLLFCINFLTKNDLFHHKNKAYGLDYEHPEIAAYQPESLRALTTKSQVDKDMAETISILENWKAKNSKDGKLPKMLFYCVSGGGLKSAAWSTSVLQSLDSLSAGQFSDQTVLISGASGGMIGSAYYRELVLRKKQGEAIDLYSQDHIYTISQDLLNPISFTIVTNDLFLPWATFEAGGHRYKKDRGYIFEKALNENTGGRLNKTLGDYREPEQMAEIPLFFLTPSIVNDGRRLVISSQPVSYMMVEPAGVTMPHAIQVDAVDFGQMFQAQGAENLRFTTALRMNATYPYVLPNVTLPSQPAVEVLDAGFRDNFGLKSATRFVSVFKDWIKENTDGVVFVIVRAFDRDRKVIGSENQGIMETIFNPLEIAFKVISLQDYEHDNELGFLFEMLGPEKFEIVRFTYQPSEFLKDSPISFYLTERERLDILSGMDQKENQENRNQLLKLMKVGPKNTGD